VINLFSVYLIAPYTRTYQNNIPEIRVILSIVMYRTKYPFIKKSNYFFSYLVYVLKWHYNVFTLCKLYTVYNSEKERK